MISMTIYCQDKGLFINYVMVFYFFFDHPPSYVVKSKDFTIQSLTAHLPLYPYVIYEQPPIMTHFAFKIDMTSVQKKKKCLDKEVCRI